MLSSGFARRRAEGLSRSEIVPKRDEAAPRLFPVKSEVQPHRKNSYLSERQSPSEHQAAQPQNLSNPIR